jgi:hypothetical protein
MCSRSAHKATAELSAKAKGYGSEHSPGMVTEITPVRSKRRVLGTLNPCNK